MSALIPLTSLFTAVGHPFFTTGEFQNSQHSGSAWRSGSFYQYKAGPVRSKNEMLSARDCSRRQKMQELQHMISSQKVFYGDRHTSPVYAAPAHPSSYPNMPQAPAYSPSPPPGFSAPYPGSHPPFLHTFAPSPDPVFIQQPPPPPPPQQSQPPPQQRRVGLHSSSSSSMLIHPSNFPSVMCHPLAQHPHSHHHYISDPPGGTRGAPPGRNSNNKRYLENQRPEPDRRSTRRMDLESLVKGGDVRELLTARHVVFLGDSIDRGLYKDLVCLLVADKLLFESDLQSKGEPSFMGDKRVVGGDQHNGIDYVEERKLVLEGSRTTIQFFFITRAFNQYTNILLRLFAENPPDVLIVHSGMWDLHRYAIEDHVALRDYRQQLKKMGETLAAIRAKGCCVFWRVLTDILEGGGAGFLCERHLRTHIFPQARVIAESVMTKHGVKIIDFSPLVASGQVTNVKDGVHWNALSNRKFTTVLIKKIITYMQPRKA